jgi:sulfonate transport system permease protein
MSATFLNIGDRTRGDNAKTLHHTVVAAAHESAAERVDFVRKLANTRVMLPWIIPFALILIWHFASTTGSLSPGVLPAPADVLNVGWSLAVQGTLLHDILVSFRRVFIGFSLGAGAGLLLGFAVGLSSLAYGLFDRSLQMVRTVPHLALVPLMILWFGIGEEPRITLVAMGTLFPVYLNTMSGVRNVDPKLVELGRSYGLSRLEVIRSIILPGALQPILVGLRYALGVGWLTLVVGETIASRDGIGYLVQNARELLRTDVIVLAIILYAVAGWLVDLLARLVERWALRWHPAYADGRAP